MVSTPPASSVQTVDGVIRLVRDWIESAQLREGDRLPTERALAEQFDINRNLVRRAFLQLDRMGLINRHVGRGTFVGRAQNIGPAIPPSPVRALERRRDDYSPATVLQARSVLEPRLAGLAAATATLADLRQLEEALELMAAAGSFATLEDLSGRFMHLVASATHNPVLATLGEELANARRITNWRRNDPGTVPEEEHRRMIADHRSILDAVRARDPIAATQAARQALQGATRNFSMLARMELLPDDEID